MELGAGEYVQGEARPALEVASIFDNLSAIPEAM
jgi:hypothetical protein